MKILVASSSLTGYGGSESHTKALHAELDRQGHDVTLCEAGGIPDSTAFDVALLTHNLTVARFFDTFPDYPPDKVVQTVHGLVPQLEKPWTRHPIRYVAISEGIAQAYPGLDMTVIPNAVDLEVFKPTRQLPENPRVLLSLAQSDSFNDMLRRICRERGIEFRFRNKFRNPISEIYEEMQEADIVVGIGRSAIEAMACGCAVLVADHRPYQNPLMDGWIYWEDFLHAMYKNYSGRSGWTADKRRMCIYIDDYQHKDGAECRRLAERYHNIEDAARKYLEVITA